MRKSINIYGNIRNKSVAVVLAICIFVFSYGCGDSILDDKPTITQIAELGTSLFNVRQTLEGAKEGFGKGQYQRGSVQIIKSYADSASLLLKSSELSSDGVKALISGLNKLHEEFKTKVVKTVAQDNLIGHWTMDDLIGEGTFDYSGKMYHGTLTKGHETYVSGKGTVVRGKNRYGDDYRALYFQKGGNVEVPFKASADEFFPTDISFSFWFNLDPDASYTDDGEVLNAPFISNGGWAGYAISLKYDKASKQRQLRMETYGHSTEYDETDAASKAATTADITELSAPGTWHHIAVVRSSDAAERRVFYVDGKKVKELINEGGDLAYKKDEGYIHNLVFGQSGPTGRKGHFEADGNGGYYNGYLDEVRMYNKVLSAEEVSEIYELEKP